MNNLLIPIYTLYQPNQQPSNLPKTHKTPHQKASFRLVCHASKTSGHVLNHKSNNTVIKEIKELIKSEII